MALSDVLVILFIFSAAVGLTLLLLVLTPFVLSVQAFSGRRA